MAAAVAGGRPLLVTAHGSYVNLPRMRRFPVGNLYQRALERARLICVSRYTAQVARELMPGARVQVINNGVDVARFLEPSRAAGRKTRTDGHHRRRNQGREKARCNWWRRSPSCGGGCRKCNA